MNKILLISISFLMLMAGISCASAADDDVGRICDSLSLEDSMMT